MVAVSDARRPRCMAEMRWEFRELVWWHWTSNLGMRVVVASQELTLAAETGSGSVEGSQECDKRLWAQY